VLEDTHERRILSWSPDFDEELAEPLEQEDDTPSAVDEQPQRPSLAVAPPAEPNVATPPAATRPPAPRRPPRAVPAAADDEDIEAGQGAAPADGPRRRGRPRGRPRRQVHFHVDPDEELLLLEAAKKHGSQQKGLIAALQALQDNEILREEVERLRTECERQRVLLADAQALFKN
jgi:hypothetical protein